MFHRSGGGSGGIAAKDALGNDVKASEWLKTHPAGDHNLVQGLKVGCCAAFTFSLCVAMLLASHSPPNVMQADATYLLVTEEGQIEKYGLNAVCTHLGCVVPWNSVSDKDATLVQATSRELCMLK